ncbi:uncharacterized protein J7T54_004248 [Emericellopsis cladophorae]|uniref:PhoD-like phosphatase metallophosphatase domain-containing protein n=1 Tax=Emericellopsis cladophorae TaxID=2686198 RepID=A0A9P9XY93_9HYPO|nr:uncharacterized protein J7T54_004248 [Emericellopsis cladophorae]KAI6780116.1 hypothetical protein J7T54_004248 [Emericellopsis cladophorae]
MKYKIIYTVAALLGSTAASFSGNLNYVSPSRRHARLGIDTNIVERRSWKRDNVAYEPSELNFTHGVASGDPWPESVVLWTRVAPSNKSENSTVPVEGTAPLWSHETEQFVEADPNPICVEWKVYMGKKNETQQTVSQGVTHTTSDIDFTVEAQGLEPLTEYNYQFNVCNSDVKSPIGRTKTAPTADDDVSSLSFAVFSCSNFPNGYFNAYGNAACKDEHDWVLHLGDYMYEYAADDDATERGSIPPNKIFTLYDYRAQVANNVYRDGTSGSNNTEESFLNDGPEISVDTRKVNAVRAYFEWMRIRQTDLDDGLRIWRSFQMGKLLDLVILDTHVHDRSITSLGWNDDYIDLIRDDPSRTLMGARQEHWFYNSLSISAKRGATWRLIGNQIIVSRILQNDEGSLSGDNWNGYIANLNRTLKHLYDNNISNNIFLAGDSHQKRVSDLVWLGEREHNMKTGQGAVGVEFAGTAVTSSGQSGPIEPNAGDYARAMIERNDEMMWQEGYYRGFFHLQVAPEKLTAQFYGSPSVTTRNPWDIPLANFTVVANENHLERPVGGVQAESGALRFGNVKHTNLTLNTETKEWEVIGFDQMFIE